ncbi:YdcF family protein [Olsenella sp. YH-ols2221]|uniref:YdcF family protein n=1 Tax=Olsenella kribbiana TaxID=3115221 RepID=UPI002ED82D65
MDLAGEGIFVVLAAAMAGLGQLWFWRLRLGEERTIWLGCAALVAAGTAILALSLLFVAVFPEDVFPWSQTLVLAILVLFLAFLLMFPVVLVVTLIVTGIRLIRREGRSLRNMLSLGLGCAMVVYVAIWPFVRSALGDIPVAGTVFDFIFGFIALLIALLGTAFAFYTVAGVVVQWPHRHRRYDAVVVLGAALMKDGTVTPLLANRVKRGIELWHLHPEAKLIMSGGQGADGLQPESHAMRAFALAQGVPEEAILVEDRSTTTRENIAFSEALREKEGLVSEGRLLVVSDDYHVFRALLITRALGIAADGAGAKVRLYFALNALVREWVAYVDLKRAVFMRLSGTVLVLYTALYLLTAFD